MPYIKRMRYVAISENGFQFLIGLLDCKRFQIKNNDVERQEYLDIKFGVSS